jgi:hypothetical protein
MTLEVMAHATCAVFAFAALRRQYRRLRRSLAAAEEATAPVVARAGDGGGESRFAAPAGT